MEAENISSASSEGLIIHPAKPETITVGKNSCIFGVTSKEDYPDNCLAGGKTFIKAGDER